MCHIVPVAVAVAFINQDKLLVLKQNKNMIVPKTTFAVLALIYGAEAARVYSNDKEADVNKESVKIPYVSE